MKTFHTVLFSGLLTVSPVLAQGQGSARCNNASNFANSTFKANSEGFRQREAVPIEVQEYTPLKVAFTLTSKGEPKDILVVSSSGSKRLDQKCVDALAKTRIEPRVFNGAAVESREFFILNPKF